MLGSVAGAVFGAPADGDGVFVLLVAVEFPWPKSCDSAATDTAGGGHAGQRRNRLQIRHVRSVRTDDREVRVAAQTLHELHQLMVLWLWRCGLRRRLLLLRKQGTESQL